VLQNFKNSINLRIKNRELVKKIGSLVFLLVGVYFRNEQYRTKVQNKLFFECATGTFFITIEKRLSQKYGIPFFIRQLV
jgi:hypothetical membrane protein